MCRVQTSAPSKQQHFALPDPTISNVFKTTLILVDFCENKKIKTYKKYKQYNAFFIYITKSYKLYYTKYKTTESDCCELNYVGK